MPDRIAGYQRRPDRRVGSKSEGCLAAQTPVDLAARADIVVTMLADGAASYAVHLGRGGLFASTGSATLVEMGTMSPDHIADLVATAPENIRVIDAPVSGATQAAASADLLVMAGCRDEDADLAAIFDAVSRQTIYLSQSVRGRGCDETGGEFADLRDYSDACRNDDPGRSLRHHV
ncbi:NAD(P)-binding domain-containing protein [Phaeobacter sp. A36a-5a]|uniref:NAD(P)-binding domain-containing protein n=1 Tax=Phaeobacter bryozoorum TaxID=1086632 RepID=UPI0030C9F42C